MPRPSQNIDQALLDAGMALLPLYGCKGLAVRQVTEHAGANLGMFHYHFKSKDVFIRAVLQRMYEAMFTELVLQGSKADSASANLRAALKVLATFTRLNGAVLSRLLADAMGGERIALEFLQASLPRHAQVILAGAVGAPIVLGGAAAHMASGQRIAAQALSLIEQHVLSDAAIEQRIEFAMRGIARPR
jgi:AcrR family transcriptional regulator